MGKAVAKIIIHKDRKVLLQLRDNNPDIPFPNHWSLLGGKIEEDETPLKAIQREIKEEINITISDPTFLETLTNNETTHHIFLLKKDIDLFTITLNEGQGLKYVDISNLDKYKITPFYKPLLKKNFNKNHM